MLGWLGQYIISEKQFEYIISFYLVKSLMIMNRKVTRSFQVYPWKSDWVR